MTAQTNVSGPSTVRNTAVTVIAGTRDESKCRHKTIDRVEYSAVVRHKSLKRKAIANMLDPPVRRGEVRARARHRGGCLGCYPRIRSLMPLPLNRTRIRRKSRGAMPLSCVMEYKFKTGKMVEAEQQNNKAVLASADSRK